MDKAPSVSIGYLASVQPRSDQKHSLQKMKGGMVPLLCGEAQAFFSCRIRMLPPPPMDHALLQVGVMCQHHQGLC